MDGWLDENTNWMMMGEWTDMHATWEEDLAIFAFVWVRVILLVT